MVWPLLPAHEEPLRCSWPIQDLAVAVAEVGPRFSTHPVAVGAVAVLHFSIRPVAVVAVGVGEGERWSLQSQAAVAVVAAAAAEP